MARAVLKRALALMVALTAAKSAAQLQASTTFENAKVRTAAVAALVEILVPPRFTAPGRVRVLRVYKGRVRAGAEIQVALAVGGCMMHPSDDGLRRFGMQPGRQYFVYLGARRARKDSFVKGAGYPIALESTYAITDEDELRAHELVVAKLLALEKARDAKTQIALLRALLRSPYPAAQEAGAHETLGTHLLPETRAAVYQDILKLIAPRGASRRLIGAAWYAANEYVERLTGNRRGLREARARAASPLHRQLVERVFALLASPSVETRLHGAELLAEDRSRLEPGITYLPSGVPAKPGSRYAPEIEQCIAGNRKTYWECELEWWPRVEPAALARWKAWYKSGGHLRAEE